MPRNRKPKLSLVTHFYFSFLGQEIFSVGEQGFFGQEMGKLANAIKELNWVYKPVLLHAVLLAIVYHKS